MQHIQGQLRQGTCPTDNVCSHGLAAHEAGSLRFFGKLRHLADSQAFARHLSPLRKIEWVVYAKRPFAGPEAVLAYLSRYTHRVAISNSRLISCDKRGVIFKYKDYRAQGRERYKTMSLSITEFIRRFLIHVLPQGFHRIRHYGFFANGGHTRNIDRARELLGMPAPETDDTHTAEDKEPPVLIQPCPHCGGAMIVIETFERGQKPRGHAPRAPPSGKADRA